MIYQNREQAAHLLAKALASYKNKHPLIAAIPRGAAPMARIIADELGGEMNVVLVRKIGAPFQEELAIGSVDEQGHLYLNAYAKDVPQDYIEQAKQKQLEVIRHRRAQYTQTHLLPTVTDRIVIVVDDGIATGATMIAALTSLRAQRPKKLIAAVAIAPPDTIKKIQSLADQVVCLETPADFYAVGQFFREFPQITDEEVIQLLQKNIDPPVKISVDNVILNGDLSIPANAKGIIIFAHGSGSSRLSPRNQFVAKVLQQANIGTLLFDLLTEEEDINYETRFDIPLLTNRLIAATAWLQQQPEAQSLHLGYFGASTGAASALMAAATLGKTIHCVVSRGGRPDLAMPVLNEVHSPTLLIVGGHDDVVIELNQQAYAALTCQKKLSIVPGATHLFEEVGTLEQAADLAKEWFLRFL